MEERSTGVQKISGPFGRTQNFSSDQLGRNTLNHNRSVHACIDFPSFTLERDWVLNLRTSRREKATSARATLHVFCTFDKRLFSPVVCVYMPFPQAKRYLGFRDGDECCSWIHSAFSRQSVNSSIACCFFCSVSKFDVHTCPFQLNIGEA